MSALTTTSGAAAVTGSKAGPSVAGTGDRVSITRRLQQELMALMMSGNKDVTAFPNGDNLFDWVGTISGSKGTAYEGLSFKLSIKFPPDYPFTAPTVTFTTPVYHPNVDAAGNICVDFLKTRWSAAYSVSSLLLSLQSLLADPNVDSPLNPHAAGLWANPVEYRKTVLKKYKEATGSAPEA